MREIKFRVWDKKEKKYLYPESQSFIIVPTKPSFGVTLPYENCSNPDNIDEDCFDWADADLLFGRYELEQYTGLKDKNGKEIYEGDIFRNAINGGTWRISWNGNDSAFWVDSRVSGCSLGEFNWDRSNREYGFIEKNCEVIGNIHENPELLECKK